MSSIKRLWRESMVIARRDFLAVAATPTFLLFLLAPLFMLGMGMVGGIGASGLADSAGQRDRMVLITDAAQHGALRAAEKRLRALNGGDARDAGPPLVLITPESNAAAQAARLIKQPDKDTLAIGYGPLSAPTILEQNSGGRSGIFLAALAEQVLRDGEMTRADTPRSTATFRDIVIQKSSNAGRQTTGFFCVFILFFLSLMLSSQTVGMMAEEKTNKVIEILAASIPLEAVFFGKLIGMFGIAILFVAFWGSMGMAATFAFGGSAGAGTAAGTAASTVVAGMPATAVTGMFAELAPAIGWPLFFGFGFLYFTMAFMLLGSIFLVIGALAATIREIQMLSLPATVFQVAMFGWASAAANAPGSMIAQSAQIFPFSSPFAMAARGATDPAIWPHLAALGWQALWVTITIWVGVRLFRIGVLKSNVGWKFWKKDRPPVVGA